MKKMLWKKKDQISMELWPKGAGWEYVYLTVNGERHELIISTVFDYGFNALLEGLYYLNPDVQDPLPSDFCPHRHIFDYASDMSDTPYQLEFCWMDEPGTTKWLIEKPKNDNPIFDLHIHIVYYHRGGEKKIIDFTVSYKEFCYVVAKAATEALKKHGILGYHKTVYYADMNLRCLLKLKAYALGCEDDIKVTCYTDTEGDISSLEAELKLLLRDM